MIRSTVLEASIVWRVERTRWPVSAASSAISMVSLSLHFAYENDFGSLTQCWAPQSQCEAGSVTVEFALVNDGALVPMHELDGIFDGQNVIGVALINPIQHGGKCGGRLSGSRGPR